MSVKRNMQNKLESQKPCFFLYSACCPTPFTSNCDKHELKSCLKSHREKGVYNTIRNVKQREYGVLNRSVLYRGLTEDNPPQICFVTERNSRKYENLKENSKISLTIVCPTTEQLWQIRLLNAEAHELNADMIKKFWQEELLFSKIRSHISECGKPNDGQDIERKCQEVVAKYEKECTEPEQTQSYTAFKIVPKLWDFYMSEPQRIADRVQYKLIEGEKDKWEVYHVDA